ncbi:MAG TPA: GatB/YqeY domain-containing protein [Candidatus Omnitrophota bacterium]|nr:GatB/YqeY domain-containing protein [Candidatus Omnitrophota bacterium]
MIENKIVEDIKASMKSGDKKKTETLRFLSSAIKSKKIDECVRDGELADDKVVSVIQKLVKQRQESIEQFKQGNRLDLVEKETAELKVLEGYLPAQMSEDEVRKIVDAALVKTGAKTRKEMGLVMREVMAAVAGRADGKIISKMVNEKLVN